ncbi:20645_t:CDS:2, partial [Funneliformis geosporum]
GHASENPKLPESLAQSKHKIVFIGPLGSAMRSGNGVTQTELDKQGHVIVSESVYEEACVKELMMATICSSSSEVPGSSIFIMRLARDARHLEVQVLADQYGNAISLFGRD